MTSLIASAVKLAGILPTSIVHSSKTTTVNGVTTVYNTATKITGIRVWGAEPQSCTVEIEKCKQDTKYDNVIQDDGQSYGINISLGPLTGLELDDLTNSNHGIPETVLLAAINMIN